MSDNQPDRDAELDAERDELTKISELSKRGYQYLKENLLNEAESCFQEIFAYDEKNNYCVYRSNMWCKISLEKNGNTGMRLNITRSVFSTTKATTTLYSVWLTATKP